MKKFLVSLLTLVTILSSTLDAAIVWDNAADLGNNTGTSFTTASFTFNTALTGGVLIVAIVGDITSGNDDITSVTASVCSCSGSLITKVTGPQRFVYGYVIKLGSVSGSTTVTVQNTNSHLVIVGASSYQGVDQTTPIDASTTGSITSNTNFPLTISPVAANSWAVMIPNKSFDGNAITAGTNSVRRAQDGTFNDWAIIDSTLNPVSSSTTINAVEVSLDNWAGIIFTLKASGGSAPACNPTLKLLGVSSCGN